MNTEATRETKTGSSAADNRIITAGEVFPDGAMLELVSGASGAQPELLLWDGRRPTVGPCVSHGGCIYEAPKLDAILIRAMPLPTRCQNYGASRDLFTGVRGLFQHHLFLPESESGLFASYAISTWFPERLPRALTLAICALSEQLGIEVLRLLSCVCRHPLMVAELTPRGFQSLPTHLSITLLLDQQRLKPDVQRLLRTSSYPGLYLPGGRGRLFDLYGPKAVLSDDNDGLDALGGDVIRISVAPSKFQTSTLDADAQREIANHFQPRLLMYRIRNFVKVRECRLDLSAFTAPTRQLAGVLARCFPEDSELAREVAQLLQPHDEEVREQRRRNVNCVIVEIVWAFLHGQKEPKIRVQELAENVNVLLKDRGGMLEYSPEEIGWKLKDFGLRRHDSSTGKQVLRDSETSLVVHKLARTYDLQWQQLAADCTDCNGRKSLSQNELCM